MISILKIQNIFDFSSNYFVGRALIFTWKKKTKNKILYANYSKNKFGL